VPARVDERGEVVDVENVAGLDELFAELPRAGLPLAHVRHAGDELVAVDAPEVAPARRRLPGDQPPRELVNERGLAHAARADEHDRRALAALEGADQTAHQRFAAEGALELRVARLVREVLADLPQRLHREPP